MATRIGTEVATQHALAVLLRFAEYVNGALELQPMLAGSLALLGDLVGCDSAWIVMENAPGCFAPQAVWRLPPGLREQDLGCTVCRCQSLMREGRLTQAVNIVTCERLAAADEWHLSRGWRHASVPLQLPDGRRGILNLAFRGERPLTARQLDLLDLVGRTLSPAVHRAELHERVKASGEETRRRLTAVLEQTSDLVAIADPDGRIVFLNQAGRQLLGLGPGEGVELSAADLFAEPVLEPPAATGAEPDPSRRVWRGEATLSVGSGVPVSVVGIEHRSPAGEVEFISIVARDISRRRILERRLARLAAEDDLTGLYNRRRFQDELRRTLDAARRRGTSGALLLVDLDGFKQVNDSLGHQAGDELLREVASRLRGCVGPGTVVARLGGDEFALLMPHVDADTAHAVATQIQGALDMRHMLVRGQPVHAAASIGITMFPEHGDRLEDLMAHADFAMYQAKERRSRLYLYGTDPAAESQLGRQLGWEQRLREALDHDRFVLFAEPILDLRTNRISQYEVLLRLIAPDGHIIAPGAFLPAAERSYLIGDIDLLVVRRAVGLLSERRHGGRPLRLHVNLSGKNFSDASFLSELRQKLTAAPVDPADLIFEITETASIGDIELARDFVQALRRQGYRFAFDDFGIGFACFSYLKVLDVDYVKIAGDFVRGLAHSLTDQRMVRAMVTAADGLGLQTIGEFVESEDTLRILREYGVAFAQGRCVGQPRPVEEVLR